MVGSSYCHNRQFKVDENTLAFFKMYNQSADNVIKEHQELYSYVEGKMKTLRLEVIIKNLIPMKLLRLL